MQKVYYPFKINTYRRNQESDSYLKNSSLIFLFTLIFIAFIIFIILLTFFIRTDCIILNLSLWNRSLRKMELGF